MTRTQGPKGGATGRDICTEEEVHVRLENDPAHPKTETMLVGTRCKIMSLNRTSLTLDLLHLHDSTFRAVPRRVIPCRAIIQLQCVYRYASLTPLKTM